MFIFFFFFKQKTAYEMRISDWSSDVCSSDLFFHLAGELLQAEGLGQEVNAGVLVEALAEAVLGIAGDEDHLQIRAGLAHLAHQARPVEARHHHVGDQQVDRRLLARQYPQRGPAEIGRASLGQESVSTCRYRWSQSH